ncbi:MAG: YidC/Oxa1 family membrane protein insertase [Minisyncoccia bacterium]
MISNLFHAAFYNPIYNILVALVAWMPWESVGLAVIILTILIRVILLPFTLSAARTQRAMRSLEPKLKELKELHKGDKEKEALATLELYKAERVNPFASILTLFIQIPVLLALYWVFRYEPFTTLDHARLYAFTPLPAHAALFFLGISVAGKSIVLAAVAGIMQYAQAVTALSGSQPASGSGAGADFQRVMGTQMKYVFPLLIAVICYTTSAAVALYFITTNGIGALQELYVRAKYKNQS